ncbi:hypothetical protein [Pseudomonas sp. NA-150]|uniref:PA0061/PA0062 family lipoprotein n=1 Tax=Pseudomonas sp. NA-150 TaxID=3367525 RepID=UPI0037CA17C4
MSSKSLLLIPMLSLVALLSACAGPMPKADPSEAWIGFSSDAQGSLLAEDVDGKRLNDGRYFEVTPGSHKLDVALFIDGGPGDNNQEECQLGIKFDGFKAGEHYQLVESSLGEEHRAELVDSHGHQLGQTKDFDCQAS